MRIAEVVRSAVMRGPSGWVVSAALAAGCLLPGGPAPAQPAAGGDEKTGEWTGSFDWTSRQPVPAGVQHFGGHLDLTLDEYEDGTLKGVLTGSQEQRLDVSTCPSVTLAPGRVTARLTGNVVERQVTISVAEPAFTPPQLSPCPGGGPPGTPPGVFRWPHFDEALRSLSPVGKREYELDREWTIYSGPYPFTVHYAVKLERFRILPHAAD